MYITRTCIEELQLINVNVDAGYSVKLTHSPAICTTPKKKYPLFLDCPQICKQAPTVTKMFAGLSCLDSRNDFYLFLFYKLRLHENKKFHCTGPSYSSKAWLKSKGVKGIAGLKHSHT